MRRRLALILTLAAVLLVTAAIGFYATRPHMTVICRSSGEAIRIPLANPERAQRAPEYDKDCPPGADQ